MPDVKKVKAANLFPLVSELLAQGQDIRLPVSVTVCIPFYGMAFDSVGIHHWKFQM